MVTALLALPPDNSLPSCALAHALVRRGARGLRLLGVPVMLAGLLSPLANRIRLWLVDVASQNR